MSGCHTRHWLLGLAALLLPLGAAASIEGDFGIGSRAVALGNAFTAVADDATALHYNPGALSALARRLPKDDGRAGVYVHSGFFYALPRLTLERGQLGPSGGLSFRDEREHDSPRAGGATLGAVVDMDRVADLPFAFGLLVYLPLDRLYYWQTPTADEVQFVMYDDRSQHLSVILGGGFRILEGLHLGAGVRILPEAQTDTIVRTEGLHSEDITSGEAARFDMRARAHAGVYWAPADSISAAFVYRDELYMNDYGQTDITGLVPSAYVHRIAHYYMPREYVLGFAWRPLAGDALLSAELSRLEWSEFLDAYGDSYKNTVFGDTWVPRIGASIRVLGETSLLAGYSYVPSPVLDDQSFTNFVDSQKHVISVGTQTRFMWALSRKLAPVDVAWHLQYHRLRDRSFVKDYRQFPDLEAWSQNAGFPGYRAGGEVLNLGVSMTLAL